MNHSILIGLVNLDYVNIYIYYLHNTVFLCQSKQISRLICNLVGMVGIARKIYADSSNLGFDLRLLIWGFSEVTTGSTLS